MVDDISLKNGQCNFIEILEEIQQVEFFSECSYSEKREENFLRGV